MCSRPQRRDKERDFFTCFNQIICFRYKCCALETLKPSLFWIPQTNLSAKSVKGLFLDTGRSLRPIAENILVATCIQAPQETQNAFLKAVNSQLVDGKCSLKNVTHWHSLFQIMLGGKLREHLCLINEGNSSQEE